MKTRLFLLSVSLTLTLASLGAQYAPPLRGPLLVTGTFGELRSNHYHGGIDFRASVGTPVRAVADGYVSRIVVSGSGFGQAIYVDHPDGKRSVYGHLEVLAPELLDTVRTLQYARESFALDLQPDSLAFPVRQGQVIGGVGNRGYSFGPHLHFEIRESATDAQLNPLSLGFEIPDTRTPYVQQIRMYGWTAAGDRLEERTYDVGSGELPDTITVGYPRVGFGVRGFDRQNSMPNRNGFYEAGLRVDTVESFAIRFDRVPIESTRYINALTDYREWQRNRNWFYLLYPESPTAVFWADPAPANGILNLSRGVPVPVTVAVRDFSGNERAISSVILFDPTAEPPLTPQRGKGYQYFLPAGEASIIDTAGLRLELSANALYRDLRFRYARLEDTSEGYLSATHQLQDEETPLHGRATLRIRPRNPVADSLRQHVYVGRCSAGGNHSPAGGSWQADGTMQTTISAFGDYALLLDTTPPEIRIKQFSTDLRGRSGFSLLLEDAVGGGLDFRGTVDGEWVLLEYDAKSGTLSHRFADGPVGAGGDTHRFELVVTDDRGNQARFERNFRR
ncbi:M23 family metallopeptidase [Lewinella sp. IMCC34183]|uniref:M23 family metallopeptidase n=1 Tax=Lewinella sp. IMCC34183 TaxID=2248762 RepID=UPI0018E4E2EE|nr:M23 family metallopeptidase [Lewinella sp. IMCC34183]